MSPLDVLKRRREFATTDIFVCNEMDLKRGEEIVKLIVTVIKREIGAYLRLFHKKTIVWVPFFAHRFQYILPFFFFWDPYLVPIIPEGCSHKCKEKSEEINVAICKV